MNLLCAPCMQGPEATANAVTVHRGEAVCERHLTSVPSGGSPQDLSAFDAHVIYEGRRYRVVATGTTERANGSVTIVVHPVEEST